VKKAQKTAVLGAFSFTSALRFPYDVDVRMAALPWCRDLADNIPLGESRGYG
jgi:hypothetical protein